MDGETSIILSGTDTDAALERWWSLGTVKRRSMIRIFADIGILFATTPNYSLFLEQPRWDDMHAMKRIAIIHSEFANEGIPAALHLNARTDRDYERWTEYLINRQEISHLAFEFTTGTGWLRRRQFHLEHLIRVGCCRFG